MSYMTLSSQEKHHFYSVHAFARIRQHYFSKYWGDGCMGRPPPQIFLGGPSPQFPPMSPPLLTFTAICSLRALIFIAIHTICCTLLLSQNRKSEKDADPLEVRRGSLGHRRLAKTRSSWVQDGSIQHKNGSSFPTIY